MTNIDQITVFPNASTDAREPARLAGWPSSPEAVATIAALGLCIVLNIIEVSRSGLNASNWGLLADLSEVILPTLAAFLLARRAIRTGHEGWWWMAAGAAAWSIGQIAWIIIQFGYHADPTVSVASIGFVGWSTLTAIGLVKIGGQNSGFTSARPVVAEALVITACSGFLVWELALASQTAGLSSFEMAMLAIVPVSDALVGSIALLLLLHGRSPAIGLIGVASVVLLVADSLLTVWFSDDAPLYATAHTLYLATFAIVAAATFVSHQRGRRAPRATLTRLVIVYVPMVAAICVGIWHYFVQHRQASVVSVFIAFSIGFFVAVSQFAVWAESGRLADRLQSNVERLSDAELHLRHLLDDLPVSVVLLSSDGVVVDVNAVTLMLTGRTRDEIIGQAFPSLLRPEDAATVSETWNRLRNGEVLTNPIFPVPKADGSVVMVEADIRAPIPRSDRIVVLLRDMTARLKGPRELEDVQKRFQIAFRAAPTGMLMSSPNDFSLLDVNDALAEMLGSTRTDLIGKSLRDITHPDDWAATVKAIGVGTRNGQSSYSLDKRLLRSDGQVVWTQTSVSLMSDEHGNELAIAHLQDITDQRRTAAHLQWAASHDELTGLPNRNHFLEQLRRRLDGAELGSIAVLFIDLDNFKVVNDSLGHAVGDELLRGMSERLRSVVRDRDMLGRFGGDEFIVMLDGLQLEVSPVDVAERLRRAISQMLIVEDAELFVTGSIGIAYADRAGVTGDELLRDADAAMYRAKARGRDCVEVFAPGAHETSVLALRTSSELRHGLERGEIVPYFQPIVDLPTGQLTGFEVLARWRHPDRGLLGPDQFLPMAEETGLIGDVGAAVLRASLTQLGRWQTSVPSLANVSISVNVSVRQLVDSRFNQLVAEALAESGVRAESLWLEITESALMSDVKAATVALRNLRSLGLHLSVDDFGTGYSSLTYLKRFPVEAIKVDRQFVKGLGIDTEDTTIVEAVVNLGRSLGLMVVAEGVETPLQLTRLREMGCDRAQGYLFGRPRPAALIEAERTTV